jgi:hypothetical protein
LRREVSDELKEYFRAGAGKALTRLRLALDPSKKEDERYPAATAFFDPCPKPEEAPRGLQRHRDARHLVDRRLGTELRRRRNKILAADKRADWVYPARLIL